MFNSLQTEAKWAADSTPPQSAGKEAEAFLAESFVNPDLQPARDAVDAAEAALGKHDGTLTTCLESAAQAVDDPKGFAVANAELERQRFIHARLTAAVDAARATLAQVEADGDRLKYAWMQDRQRRIAAFVTERGAELRKTSAAKLLKIAMDIRAYECFARDVFAADAPEMRRLSDKLGNPQ